jgi:hypothetical protein
MLPWGQTQSNNVQCKDYFFWPVPEHGMHLIARGLGHKHAAFALGTVSKQLALATPAAGLALDVEGLLL